MEVSGQLHALAALPSGKSLHYPLGMSFGEPQSRSGGFGGETFLNPSAVQPVAICYTAITIPAHDESIVSILPLVVMDKIKEIHRQTHM
jgi:hypothetical protein